MTFDFNAKFNSRAAVDMGNKCSFQVNEEGTAVICPSYQLTVQELQ